MVKLSKRITAQTCSHYCIYLANNKYVMYNMRERKQTELFSHLLQRNKWLTEYLDYSYVHVVTVTVHCKIGPITQQFGKLSFTFTSSFLGF